jgi:hypothetical protein
MEILQTKHTRPLRALIYGSHGLGKSSLAAAAPEPLFINLEDGLSEIDTVALPQTETFTEFMDQLRLIYSEDHGKKTLVIDSIDKLEVLIFQHVSRQAGVDAISDIPYGQGYGSALAEFNRVIAALTAISVDKNMHIILLAHAEVREFKNPLGENYDVYRVKLREKNGELFAEFVSLIGFLRFDVRTKTKQDGFSESTKVLPNAQRVLCCAPTAQYDAKNRYGINKPIPVPDPTTGWDNLIKAVYGKGE